MVQISAQKSDSILHIYVLFELPRWLPINAGDTEDTSLIPGLGRFPGEGNGNPLQYSCLENPMDERRLVGYSP